jgi:hypothetical protein
MTRKLPSYFVGSVLFALSGATLSAPSNPNVASVQVIPESNGFTWHRSIQGNGFVQQIYSKHGSSLSLVLTNFATSQSSEVMELELRQLQQPLNASQPGLIRVVAPKDMAAISMSLRSLAFVTFGPAPSRVEVVGLADVGGRILKMRYTNPSSTDPRVDASEAVAAFKQLAKLP